MDLGVGHAAALEPAVEHLGDPSQHTLPTPGGDGQAVNAGRGEEFGVSVGGTNNKCTNIMKTNGRINKLSLGLSVWNLIYKYLHMLRIHLGGFWLRPKQQFHNLSLPVEKVSGDKKVVLMLC